MSSPDEAPTFGSVLEDIVSAAGGPAALADAARVRPATLRRWLNGDYPTDRLTGPVERVDSWARRNMKDTYPPPGQPKGLRGFIKKPAPSAAELLTAEPAAVEPPPVEPAATEPAEAQRGEAAQTSEPVVGPVVEPEPAPAAGLEPVRSLSPRALGGRRAILVLLVLLGAFFVGGAVWWWARPASPPPVVREAQGRTIVVQNKVAFGPSSLEEDDSPSYLASRPVARCADQPGCKLEGTDLASGDTVQAVCQLQGELLTNANVSSPGIKSNPNVAGSALWYGVDWKDGRRGYISEVYIGPTYRGGLGLPPC